MREHRRGASECLARACVSGATTLAPEWISPPQQGAFVEPFTSDRSRKPNYPANNSLAGLYCLVALVYFNYMFNDEVKRLLIQVISSWQVWAVTAVLIIYVIIVNNVARIYRRPRRSRMPIVPESGPEKSAGQAPMAVPSDSDDLGLEDETPAGKKAARKT